MIFQHFLSNKTYYIREIMAQELIYTSVPRGLITGSDGYCTVAYTDGMPANMIKLLESFSDYSFLNLDDPNLKLSPVSFRHYRHSLGSQTYNIISRVAFAGFDYTKRSNKLAHHIVLSPDETLPAGPAWLSLQDKNPLFETEWNKEPALIKYKKTIKTQADSITELTTWKKLAGDAGWAGKLAEAYLASPGRPSYIVYNIKDADKILTLITEAMKLIPEDKRWQVTYNTYFSGIRSTECNWRCCLSDSRALRKARSVPGTLIIDLTKNLPKAEGKDLVQAARDAKFPSTSEENSSSIIPTQKQPVESAEDGDIAIFADLKKQQKKEQIAKAAELQEAEVPQSQANKNIPNLKNQQLNESNNGLETIQLVKKEKTDLENKKTEDQIPQQNNNNIKSKTNTLIIATGSIIIFILLIIIVMLLKSVNNKPPYQAKHKQQSIKNATIARPSKTTQKIENKITTEHPAKKSLVTKIPKKQKITVANKPLLVNKKKLPVSPPLTHSDNKNNIKQAPKKPSSSKLITKNVKPVKKKKFQASTVDISKLNLWTPYQQKIQKLNKKNQFMFEIPLVGLPADLKLELVIKPEPLAVITEKLGHSPIQSKDGNLKIYGLSDRIDKQKPFLFCEFALMPASDGSILRVSKMQTQYAPLNMSKDITAIKLNGTNCPLVYKGFPLKDGYGSAQAPNLRNKYTASFSYSWNDTDKAAGLGKTNALFEFIPFYKTKKLNFKITHKNINSTHLVISKNAFKFFRTGKLFIEQIKADQQKYRKIVRDKIPTISKIKHYAKLQDKALFKYQNRTFPYLSIIVSEARKAYQHTDNPFQDLDKQSQKAKDAIEYIDELPPKLKKNRNLKKLKRQLKKFTIHINNLEKAIVASNRRQMEKNRLSVIKVLGNIKSFKTPKNRIFEDLNDLVQDLHNPQMNDINKIYKNTSQHQLLYAVNKVQSIEKALMKKDSPLFLKAKEELLMQYLKDNPQARKEFETFFQNFKIEVKWKKTGKTVKTITFDVKRK